MQSKVFVIVRAVTTSMGDTISSVCDRKGSNYKHGWCDLVFVIVRAVTTSMGDAIFTVCDCKGSNYKYVWCNI